MRVIGIDPGLTRMGFGVVEQNGARLVAVAHGTVRAAGDVPGDKLVALRDALDALIARHAPAEAAVERLFVNRNRRTATNVGQARGVAVMALSARGLPVAEYGPMEVKMSLTGYGSATKDQVGFMVKRLLRLDADPDSADAADALAIAITHLHARRINQAVAR